MKNINNIMLMLNKIENSLNELSRRVSALEGRQSMSRPMPNKHMYIVNPYNIPTQMPGFMSNEMSGSYGNNPRGPQPNPQYNQQPYPQYKPQHSPQYTVSRGIDELKSIKGYLLNHATNDDDVFNKIDAIERILLDGIINLQHNYNYSHSVVLDLISISKAVSDIHFKHYFDVHNNKYISGIRPSGIPNLNAIKHDINVLVSNYNIETVNSSNVNNPYTDQPVGKENLSDMEERVNNNGYKYQQPTMSNYSNGYKPCINRQMYPPIIDDIIKGSTTVYNVKLTVFEKYALNKLKSLNNVPEDIYDDVNSLYTRIVKQECTPENLRSQLTAITVRMCNRGYLDDYVDKEETTNNKPGNSVENIEQVDQDNKPAVNKPKSQQVRKK